jgi:hypothetical protein
MAISIQVEVHSLQQSESPEQAKAGLHSHGLLMHRNFQIIIREEWITSTMSAVLN